MSLYKLKNSLFHYIGLSECQYISHSCRLYPSSLQLSPSSFVTLETSTYSTRTVRHSSSDHLTTITFARAALRHHRHTSGFPTATLDLRSPRRTTMTPLSQSARFSSWVANPKRTMAMGSVRWLRLCLVANGNNFGCWEGASWWSANLKLGTGTLAITAKRWMGWYFSAL